MSTTAQKIVDDVDAALAENDEFLSKNLGYRLDELDSEIDEIRDYDYDDYVDGVTNDRFDSERGRHIHATRIA